MLDGLVLADRPVEYDALLRIVCRARERDPAEAHRLGGDQDALGIHAVQNVFEAAAFVADAVGGRHLQSVDEHLVRIDRFAPHFRNLARFHEVAVEIGIEEA